MSGSCVCLNDSSEEEELVQLVAWYHIRDILLGENGGEQDVKKALELASVCVHPNAVWLTQLFAGRGATSHEDAKQIFLGCDNDVRAGCLAGVLSWDAHQIRRAAALGDAFAQAKMTYFGGIEHLFEWALKSASGGERDGFRLLGQCYLAGCGCDKDKEQAKKNCLRAARLNLCSAMIDYGLMLDSLDPQRFVWFAKPAAFGRLPCDFLESMRSEMTLFNSGEGHATLVFVIGRLLSKQIDNEKKLMFGFSYKFDSLIGAANQAVEFYNLQLQSYRKAVDSWTLVGLRNSIVKDIRLLIAKMIWEARDKAKYDGL
jgi:hypothetical protein